MLELNFNNWVIWAIFALGAVIYFQLFREIIEIHLGIRRDNNDTWSGALETMITALPLLGLLGTITGLLQTFFAMSLGRAEAPDMLTGGIADALLTTQCGLATAIPAWLMLHYLHVQHDDINDSKVGL